MYQPLTEYDKWSSSAKRFYKEKIEIFINTVLAVSKASQIKLEDADEALCAPLFIEMGFIKATSDLAILKSIFKQKLYDELITCGSTVVSNRSVFDPLLIKLNETLRKNIQEAMNSGHNLTVADFFCGAGGLSLGFLHEGCRIVFANDIDELCIESYKYNHPEVPEQYVFCGDIRKMVPSIGDFIPADVDIVIGGPPCQGFSSANKHHRVINDPRNELYKYYVKAVEQLVPKIVVMENVRGMLKVADQVVEDFENIHVKKNEIDYQYSMSYRLLNSVSFSVAQSRERLIYIAIRNDIANDYGITPDDIFNSIEKQCADNPVFNLCSALDGVRSLEPPEVMGVGEIDTEEAGRKIDVNPYTGQENDYLKLINDNRNIPLVFNHKARYCSANNHEIYRRMKPGDDGTAPQIADIFPYASRNDKFKDKYYRLYADRPCRTITAHLRSDCHSHIHPTEHRTLTPREAARVQSFPDDYFFLGPYLKTYIQIGNAVPPLMSRGIAKALLGVLKGNDINEN